MSDIVINKEYLEQLQIDNKKERIADNKLIKEIAENTRRSKTNKEIFSEEEPKVHTCSMYNPCAICYKCQNKASHLYVRCQSCKIPICTHKYKDREFMIKRDNFRIEVTDEVKQELKELGKKY